MRITAETENSWNNTKLAETPYNDSNEVKMIAIIIIIIMLSEAINIRSNNNIC